MKNRILIVDDEKSNLMYLNSLLGAEYTLYITRSGAEAIERANECVPDLILLDIIMPEMDGYEVLSELKKGEKTKEVPVIFITGLTSTKDETKGLEMGADDYISKPFQDEIVRLRIRNQLKLVNNMRLIIEKELAEKTSRAKSEFLSRMNHEIRTPLNAIIGLTNLALHVDDPVKRHGYLEKSSAASRHLLRLIEDVLDVSDLREGNFLLDSSEMLFKPMIQRILKQAGPQFKKKSQVLNTEIDPSIPEILLGDERRLAHVIGKLLSNAAKFTQGNGIISLKASVILAEEENLTVQIDVSDNGIGIPKDRQDEIFTMFGHQNDGVSRKYDGAGLGLHLSKTIVEMMGGKIWVESEPGKGSRFSFTFRALRKTPEPEKATSSTFSGKTALLADDIEINRDIIMAILEDTQMQFVCAENGREVAEIFEADQKKFDVILMDINMPVLDGVGAARRIRALDTPEAKRVPIIAVTANTTPEDIKSYYAAGMNDHIKKPVDFDEVIRKISTHIL